ncbi:MAG: hypothetical protein A2284_04410 [Deltaproteobacteria bacterium RIFOXYA12_FULL_61_11]|nr:MAG: hypothetical protein A2284_04410 [Deltaproteobacteria bacterium RIFOXYA12_FULL_61_11]
MKRWIAGAIVGLGCWLASSSAQTTAFFKANAQYAEQRYAEALASYEELRASGLNSPALHYNLGNTLYRLGKLGRALASYRRAELLAPRDEDLQANIRFVKELARDRLEPSETGQALRVLAFWYHGLSLNELLALTLVFNAVFWALWVLRRRWDGELLRWVFHGVLALTLCFAGSSAIKAFTERFEQRAVVIHEEVQVRSGKGGAVLFNLHEAAEVEVEAEAEGWYKIVLPDGKKGWVDRTFVELL